MQRNESSLDWGHFGPSILGTDFGINKVEGSRGEDSPLVDSPKKIGTFSPRVLQLEAPKKFLKRKPPSFLYTAYNFPEAVFFASAQKKVCDTFFSSTAHLRLL